MTTIDESLKPLKVYAFTEGDDHHYNNLPGYFMGFYAQLPDAPTAEEIEILGHVSCYAFNKQTTSYAIIGELAKRIQSKSDKLESRKRLVRLRLASLRGKGWIRMVEVKAPDGNNYPSEIDMRPILKATRELAEVADWFKEDPEEGLKDISGGGEESFRGGLKDISPQEENLNKKTNTSPASGKKPKVPKTPPPPPRYPSLQYTALDEKLPILRTRIGAFAMEAAGITDNPASRVAKGMKSTPVYLFLEELLISTSHPDKGMMLGSVLSWLYLDIRATPQQVIDFLRHYVNEVAVQGNGYDLPKPVEKWKGNWKKWQEEVAKSEPPKTQRVANPNCPKCGGTGRVRVANPDRYSTEQIVRDCTCVKEVPANG